MHPSGEWVLGWPAPLLIACSECPSVAKQTDMKKGWFNEVQIIGLLREQWAGSPIVEACRRRGHIRYREHNLGADASG